MIAAAKYMQDACTPIAICVLPNSWKRSRQKATCELIHIASRTIFLNNSAFFRVLSAYIYAEYVHKYVVAVRNGGPHIIYKH